MDSVKYIAIVGLGVLKLICEWVGVQQLLTKWQKNDSSPGVQVFAWNCTLLPEGNAERVCPTTDTEINIQELTLRAENQHENLR